MRYVSRRETVWDASWLERVPVEDEAGGSSPLTHPMIPFAIVRYIRNQYFQIQPEENICIHLLTQIGQSTIVCIY